MDYFEMKLAGQSIQIECQYATTRSFCRDYLYRQKESDSQAMPIEVLVQKKDIVFEREKSEQEDKREGIPVRHFSNEYLETLAVYRKIAEQMIERNILLFHGSCIAVDGQGYLFAAKSGTGKSTHTRLWRNVFGSRAVMVNDDKPLLEVTPEGVTVHGTPWDGKHRLSSPIAVPLAGLCILKRSPSNEIHRISKKEAYPMLVQQSFRSADGRKLMASLDLIDRIAAQVPLYELHCNMEQEAAMVAYEGMQASTE